MMMMLMKFLSLLLMCILFANANGDDLHEDVVQPKWLIGRLLRLDRLASSGAELTDDNAVDVLSQGRYAVLATYARWSSESLATVRMLRLMELEWLRRFDVLFGGTALEPERVQFLSTDCWRNRKLASLLHIKMTPGLVVLHVDGSRVTTQWVAASRWQDFVADEWRALFAWLVQTLLTHRFADEQLLLPLHSNEALELVREYSCGIPMVVAEGDRAELVLHDAFALDRGDSEQENGGDKDDEDEQLYDLRHYVLFGALRNASARAHRQDNVVAVYVYGRRVEWHGDDAQALRTWLFDDAFANPLVTQATGDNFVRELGADPHALLAFIDVHDWRQCDQVLGNMVDVYLHVRGIAPEELVSMAYVDARMHRHLARQLSPDGGGDDELPFFALLDGKGSLTRTRRTRNASFESILELVYVADGDDVDNDRSLDGCDADVLWFTQPWCGFDESFAPTWQLLIDLFAGVDLKFTRVVVESQAQLLYHRCPSSLRTPAMVALAPGGGGGGGAGDNRRCISLDDVERNARALVPRLLSVFVSRIGEQNARKILYAAQATHLHGQLLSIYKYK
jgi:hypothetical protein